MRYLRLDDGHIVTVSVSIKNFPRSHQTYAYLQFKKDRKTTTRYVGKVTAGSRFESISLGWKLLKEKNLEASLKWHWVHPT